MMVGTAGRGIAGSARAGGALAGGAAIRRTWASAAVIAAFAAAGCTSPEADRVRGGDAGADRGNRDAVVEIHEGADQYADTPCLTTLAECTGPMPVSGLRYDGEDR